MKSKIKIDYERGNHNYPVIKIIVPQENLTTPISPGSNEDFEEEVQDRLVKDLLHSPGMSEPNNWFEIKTTFPLDNGARLTTIGAIQEKDLFYRFRHAILNRLIPYEYLVKINRGEIPAIPETQGIGKRPISILEESVNKHNQIMEFFDWVEATGYCTVEERQPNLEKADKNTALYNK